MLYGLFESWITVYLSGLDLQDIQVWENSEFTKILDQLTTNYLLTEANYLKFSEMLSQISKIFSKKLLLHAVQLSEPCRKQLRVLIQIFNTNILPLFQELGLTQAQIKGYPFISTFHC